MYFTYDPARNVTTSLLASEPPCWYLSDLIGIYFFLSDLEHSGSTGTTRNLPRMSKQIFLPTVKEEPGTNALDITSNVAVIQWFFRHVGNPDKA